MSEVLEPPRGIVAGAWRLLDYNIIVFLRTWKGTVVTSFVTPLLTVVAMGVLLGGFVEVDPARLDGAPTYLAFIAPGLVASHAMTIAFSEMTYPVMGMVKWQKIYFSMIATPLRVPDLALAHLAYLAFRVFTACGVFLAILAPFGVYASVWGALVAVPVQVLIGLAFAAPIYGWAAGLDSEAGFSHLFRLGMVPLTLFSGAFFPITNLGPVLEWIARVTPLWQGVSLNRMLTLGQVDPGPAAVHVAYLLAMVGFGWWLVLRRLQRRLIG